MTVFGEAQPRRASVDITARYPNQFYDADVELVYKTTAEAVARARKGGGPTLIETVTYRLRGHSAADMGQYMPKETVKLWSEERHRVKLYRDKLIARGLLTAKKSEEMEAAIKAEVEEAVQYATAQPLPEPDTGQEGVNAG